jgi:ethanolamine utilization protein EutP (predicted NTPase)
MRNKRLAALVVAILAICLLSPSLFAEEKMVGVITKIELSGQDATIATVTLKDNKTEELVVIVINDELTLDKLKDHRIVEDDEIRCKYEIEDGKNVSTYFRKTAGC